MRIYHSTGKRTSHCELFLVLIYIEESFWSPSSAPFLGYMRKLIICLVRRQLNREKRGNKYDHISLRS